jgi:hypothetical protein
MDKSCTKLIAKALNIPTLDYIRVNENDYKKRGAFLLKSIESRLKYPVVVKPAHLGSSIGIAVARNEEEIKRAVETAFALDDRVIVEKYLEEKNKELVAAAPQGRRNDVQEDKIVFIQAEVAMIPQNKITLPSDKVETFLKMIDALEENDDVQNVYHNVDLPDDAE